MRHADAFRIRHVHDSSDLVFLVFDDSLEDDRHQGHHVVADVRLLWVSDTEAIENDESSQVVSLGQEKHKTVESLA